ncbi:hypothetical protein [Natrarchaeobaculum aegyptiacum]|uniref:Uncharacterized protein n=1 Tax=Natrarchaeobaculum aegyptiacum TaxID=745377 RepID=A0A2Z2HRG8_9EURY|nr:hypothetical protein [Natrarchaeobaculum aegyptiacum]ARS89642.1 hypothetical protein B1756_07760 [Natrarchaeobaculum aegyptiacum]
MATRNGFDIGRMTSNYANLRTIPAVLGVLFGLMSLYQFGAFGDTLGFAWFDYELTAMHAMVGSLIVYVIAFASSETRSFDHYHDGEKVLIAVSVLLILLYPQVDYAVTLVEYHDPGTMIVAWLVTISGYGVAIR